MREGATTGPCFLLGHIPTYRLVEVAIDNRVLHLAERPGGIAWVLGRVRLVEALLRAAGNLSPDGLSLINNDPRMEA
ncbi:hypothetical protein [Luteimicrobium subarcticum]|uniref:Uncharacterized protein n=1 Tax=Luteimicrobium subarcticum TaxID=620910 RepID=A0A2M8WJF0_9MICO|nr:hypothetical protein [Luteimicrobium subarcticum]PJI91042.1 hypothetical protein CLV34_2301 [Luteimicrobium subarcticum]